MGEIKLLLLSVLVAASGASAAQAAPPPSSGKLAVVAFGECSDPGLTLATRSVRHALTRSLGAKTLSEEATAAPAGGLPGPSLDELRRILEVGKTHFLNLSHEEAESTLRASLPDIDRLPLGPQRWEAFWETRAWLARVLQHAGKRGKATELFLQVLRVNEEFALDRVEFPPSSRELVETTRSLLPGLPRSRLAVTTSSGKGQVYLNGFSVGPAPFQKKLINGEYSLVVADGPKRSFVRRLTLGQETAITVDLDRESRFSAEGGPCFRSGPDRSERLQAVPLIAASLGVEQLVVVRVERLGGEDYVAAALVEVAKGREVREARVRREGLRVPPLARLAQFVLTGEGSPDPLPEDEVPDEALLPPPKLASATSAPAEPDQAIKSSESGGMKWQRPVAYALWGAALVLGGVGIYEHVHTNDLEAEAGALVTEKGGGLASMEAKARYDELLGSAESARSARTGLLVGAAAAALGGGAFFAWSVLPGTDATGGTQVTVSLAGRF
ncbi:MAG: PEGA domain-containing protein [Deltaproteobacteria bacterium]|nr:PEGA domain-containing protein [Deltaproteobacteria bacterium]